MYPLVQVIGLFWHFQLSWYSWPRVPALACHGFLEDIWILQRSRSITSDLCSWSMTSLPFIDALQEGEAPRHLEGGEEAAAVADGEQERRRRQVRAAVPPLPRHQGNAGRPQGPLAGGPSWHDWQATRGVNKDIQIFNRRIFLVSAGFWSKYCSKCNFCELFLTILKPICWLH